MTRTGIGLALLGMLGCSGVGAAQATKKDAVALVEKGARYLAMRVLNKGIPIAHPTPRIAGKNLLDVPDADGKMFRRERVAAVKDKGKGWGSYKFSNPVSGHVGAKTTYIMRVGDVPLEAGVYKR